MPGFESAYPVAVSQDPAGWVVALGSVLYHDPDTGEVFEIPVGATTDFGSIHQLLMWLVGPDEGIPATVLHDDLWRRRVPAGELSYRDADRVFQQALRTLGVPRVTYWTMWAAVRWGALLSRPGGWRGWWRDAPRVIPISAGVGVLAAPAVVLLPFWVLWQLLRVLLGRPVPVFHGKEDDGSHPQLVVPITSAPQVHREVAGGDHHDGSRTR